MVLAIAKILISTEECFSLKEKRKIIMSIKDRLKRKFNFSVAEIDLQEIYNRGMLGLVCISNETSYANSLISKAINFIEVTFPGRIIDYQVEIDIK